MYGNAGIKGDVQSDGSAQASLKPAATRLSDHSNVELKDEVSLLPELPIRASASLQFFHLEFGI